jgi:hypothetical protein
VAVAQRNLAISHFRTFHEISGANSLNFAESFYLPRNQRLAPIVRATAAERACANVILHS